jgi:hypothetical protein
MIFEYDVTGMECSSQGRHNHEVDLYFSHLLLCLLCLFFPFFSQFFIEIDLGILLDSVLFLLHEFLAIFFVLLVRGSIVEGLSVSDEVEHRND